jgi:hypothetical protein
MRTIQCPVCQARLTFAVATRIFSGGRDVSTAPLS